MLIIVCFSLIESTETMLLELVLLEDFALKQKNIKYDYFFYLFKRASFLKTKSHMLQNKENNVMHLS